MAKPNVGTGQVSVALICEAAWGLQEQSGAYKGKRRIRGGRTKIRTVMFMAMMSTIQSNTKFKAEYNKLVAKGKPKKVALIACMRKMIAVLNTMVKNDQIWHDKLA